VRGLPREPSSIALAVVGSVLLLAGMVLFYAREEIIKPEPFADKAEDALADDEVRVVVSREIVVNLVETGSPDLVAGRPVLESVVGTVIDTTAFSKLFRKAALEANKVFFDRNGENLVFDVADASKIVRFGLQQASPGLAKQVPKNLDVTLADLRDRKFAQSTLGAADDIRLLGLLLPLLALLSLAGSIAVSTDRRLGVLRVAVGVGTAGALLAVAMLILREVIVAGTYGSDELTDEEVRGAVVGVIDAYFGQLFGWALLTAFVGIVVAGAAAALDQKGLENPTGRLRERLTRTPATTAGRVGRAVAAIVAGFLIAAQPEVALQIIALLAGAYLVFWGASELLVMLEGPAKGRKTAEARRRRTLKVAAATAAVVIAAIAIGLTLVLDSADDPETNPLAREGCNGSEPLCDLPLNDVLFAGTHNSFSAADSPGWLIANQRRDIPRQLRDGIRLFLIDTHWGVEDDQGRVRTDFESEKRDRNKVVKALPPPVLAAAERLTGRIGLREGDDVGEREVFLCHTTCELGATRLSVALGDYRTFLDRNPGEVVILFVEPYVGPADFAQAIEDAGLDRYAKALELDEPMPTLGELVEEDKRLVVFAEHDGGNPSWYMDGFSFVQDTPLGATKISETSCALERGDATSPFLMVNNWADVFPPKRGANSPFLTKEFLTDRIRRCAEKRGLPVSLIATDHYDQGDFVDYVERINAQRAAKAAGADAEG
jgi:hypothetical protein